MKSRDKNYKSKRLSQLKKDDYKSVMEAKENSYDTWCTHAFMFTGVADPWRYWAKRLKEKVKRIHWYD